MRFSEICERKKCFFHNLRQDQNHDRDDESRCEYALFFIVRFAPLLLYMLDLIGGRKAMFKH